MNRILVKHMKHFIGILVIAVFCAGFYSCSKTTIRKPDKLIPKDKFEKMLIDVYMAQGISSLETKKPELEKLSSTDLYYSVLKKYEVADTVFIRSLIYYSSFPKEFEKTQNRIMDYLNQSEQDFHPNDILKMNKE